MEPIVLKTPSNAVPRQTDKIAVTALAGVLRALKVSKATAATRITVKDGSGNDMAFFVQGAGVDGDAVSDGYPLAAGDHDIWTTDDGSPTRGAVIPESYILLVAGAEADPVIHVESDLHRGNG